jgi:hypothetical protein
MKQTAVEWLEDNLLSEPWAEEHFEHNAECWDKAKEIEKQQIFDTWDNGFDNGNYYGKYNENCEINSGEQYYNNTFKNKTDEKDNNTDNNSNSRLHL